MISTVESVRGDPLADVEDLLHHRVVALDREVFHVACAPPPSIARDETPSGDNGNMTRCNRSLSNRYFPRREILTRRQHSAAVRRLDRGTPARPPLALRVSLPQRHGHGTLADAGHRRGDASATHRPVMASPFRWPTRRADLRPVVDHPGFHPPGRGLGADRDRPRRVSSAPRRSRRRCRRSCATAAAAG